MSYGIYGLFATASSRFGHVSISFHSFEAFSNEAIPVPWPEIMISSLIGAGLAIAAAYVYTEQIINRLGQTMRVSSRIGDDDLWNYFHHHLSPDIGWAFVRDQASTPILWLD